MLKSLFIAFGLILLFLVVYIFWLGWQAVLTAALRDGQVMVLANGRFLLPDTRPFYALLATLFSLLTLCLFSLMTWLTLSPGQPDDLPDP